MSERIIACAVLLILVCADMIHQAKAQESTAKIVGVGARQCSEFLQQARSDPSVQRDYLAWAQGLMSGVLLSRPAGQDEGLDLSPAQFPLLQQLEFLKRHCDDHPSEGFTDAVIALYKRLRMK